MSEKVGVVIGRKNEGVARAIAERLGPCFDVAFHVVEFPQAPLQSSFGDTLTQGRWIILAIPLFQYASVVPDLVHAIPPDKFFIAISNEQRAVAALRHYASNRLWAVLRLPNQEIIHWYRYHPQLPDEEMEVTLECIGRSVSHEQYEALRARLGKQTPGIAIKIVP